MYEPSLRMPHTEADHLLVDASSCCLPAEPLSSFASSCCWLGGKALWGARLCVRFIEHKHVCACVLCVCCVIVCVVCVRV
jgi:hypothetical protein